MRNPFEDICKADDLKSEIIKVIFETETKIWDKILQPSNHVVIGSKGSGKSMLLKKLSASLMTEDDFPKTHKFFGIYIHISHIIRDFNTIFNTIQRSFNDDTTFWNKKLIMIREIYPQYVSLHLLIRFCKEIEDSSIYSFEKKKIANDIGNLIGLKDTKGLQEIMDEVNKQIMQIDEFLAGEWLISNEFRPEYRLNIHTLPEAISNIIYKNTNEPIGKMYVYFLLDTSEYIHPECQKVCNSFFERGFPFRTKLAIRPYHLNTLETLSGRKIKQDTEFRVLFLDYLLNDKDIGKKFLCTALKKYLNYIKNNYSEYKNISLIPAKFLGIEAEKVNEIFSFFSIVSIRDFINFLATAWNMIKIEEGKEITLSLDYIKSALKEYARVQFDQIGEVEPLDKNIDSSRSYPWEKVKSFYSFLTSYLKELSKEKKKMELLTFGLEDLFISEDIQTMLLKPAFAEGIFRFCSEEDSYLLSVPNKFYLAPLYLNAPQIELYEYGKGEHTIKTNEKEIKESIKILFKRKEKKREIQERERYTAFLSCSFEKDPLPKESRDSIKKAFKSVKIDVYDAEDCDITFKTQGIADKIKEFDFFILELSKLTPNIMFEFGIAATFEKFITPIVNEEKENALANTIQSLEIPLTIREYSLESLKEIVYQIREAVDTRIKAKGKLYEPLFNSTTVRPLKPTKVKKNMIYISYPKLHRSLWEEKVIDKIDESFKDYYTVITDEDSELTSIEATRYQVPIHCIWQSKFCIIDTSGEEMPDLFQSYILGLCFGFRKNTLRIEERNMAKKEKISLLSSYSYATWTDIQNLVDEISKFIRKGVKK